MKRNLYLLLLLLFASPVTLAIKVNGLYQATVPVKNESAQGRPAALRQVLENVLVKLTGNKSVLLDPGAAGILKRSERFVQQFSYKEVAVDKTDNPDKPGLVLQARFDEQLLTEVMRDYGLSIWGSERPAVLVWLVNDDINGRRIVSFDESPEFIRALDKCAIDRGISLLFPLLDLEDSTRITSADLWGVFRQPIIDASSRYPADAILVGKIRQPVTGISRIDWTLIDDGQLQTWQSGANLVAAALYKGGDELVDRLASEYASSGFTRAELIKVEIENINSIDDYARALSYLESLQSVTSVIVKRLNTERVVFDVIIHGGSRVLNQAVALSNQFEVIDDSLINRYRLIK